MGRKTEAKQKRRLARKSMTVPNYMPKLIRGLELPQNWGETAKLFKTRQFLYLKDTIAQAAKPLNLNQPAPAHVPEPTGEGTDERVSEAKGVNRATSEGKEQEDSIEEHQEDDGRGLPTETGGSSELGTGA